MGRGRRHSWILAFLVALVVPILAGGEALAVPGKPPAPLLRKGTAVDWWFVFKMNSRIFPGCGGDAVPSCTFGGDVQDYVGKHNSSQRYVVAGSSRPDLREGEGCLGDGDDDPVSATFGQVYGNPSLYYVLWNDQFYEDPEVQGCGESCSGPWGHSKGMLAWNDAGEGFVMQVTTPSWPASGSALHPRPSDGNTLACIDDNNVQVSQHFFALRLKKGDLEKVLDALQNASVVTLVDNPQVVHNGGPADIQERVKALGHKSASKDATLVSLSVKGVRLLSKPSKLNVPPWQLVSAKLGSTPLKAATWRMGSRGIPSTTATTPIECWDPALGHPGAVVNATTGQWDDTMFGLRGGLGNGNHAKFGVSLDPKRPYAIFGDLNQEGKLAGKCRSSQNGRGGTFFVVENRRLFQSLTNLLDGEVEPP